MKKARNPYLACMLSLVSFGSTGQLYNGQIVKALLCLAAYIVFIVLLVASAWHCFAYLMLGASAGIVIVWLFTCVDAFRSAKRLDAIELKWYTHWYVYLFWTVLFIVSDVGLYVRAYFVGAFKVRSGSMAPTIMPDDHLIVDKHFNSESEIKRGDVVVFTLPDDPNTDRNESQVSLMKRIIALPGETISVRSGRVYLNGEQLSEPYAQWVDGGLGANFEEQSVPEHKVFLLGDNRDRSRDSRYWSDPFLEVSRVRGKALFVYWSTSERSRIGTVIR